MSQLDRGIDSLQWYLAGTGLGGARGRRIRGLGTLVTQPIPALRIDDAFPGCGQGSGEVQVDAAGLMRFVPPDGVAGSWSVVPPGLGSILSGGDPNKAIRVFSELGLSQSGNAKFNLIEYLDGPISHGNVSDAQRAAGVTTYRAVILLAPSDEVRTIKLWFPAIAGAQATYSLATDVAPTQVVADEFTAPTGVTWVTPTSEGTALSIPLLAAGASKGLWIRRAFPVGHVAARETVQLTVKYMGA